MMDYLVQEATGYYHFQSKPVAKPHSELKLEQTATGRESDVIFIDTGGTITSTPNFQGTGVGSTGVGLARLGELLKSLGVGYMRGPLLKNSEYYTLDDYNRTLLHISKTREKRVIVGHGTDNFSLMSSALAYLAKATGKKIVLVGTQRSIDKPTWEGELLIRHGRILLNRMSKGYCYALTYGTANTPLIHSPLEVKKVHTSKKRAFYSRNQVFFSESLPKYKLKKGLLQLPPFPPVYYLFPTNSDRGAQAEFPLYHIGYGIGNTPLSGQNSRFIGSRVNSGPLNPIIYRSDVKGEEKLDWSIEARLLAQLCQEGC